MCNLLGEIGGERSFTVLNMHGLLGIYRTQASISYKQKSAVYVAYSQSGTSHLISQWFLYQTIDNEMKLFWTFS